MDSQGIGSGITQPSQNLSNHKVTGSQTSVRACFSNSSHSVSLSNTTVLLEEQQNVVTENPVSDTVLSDRSAENVTDKEPGRIKQALSWLGGKAKAKGALLKEGAVKTFYKGRETALAAKELAGAKFQALKDNSKGTLKKRIVSVGSEIKSRAASLPGKVKKLLPSRPEKLSFAKVKSLLSRAAKQVPPTPSASVKAATGNVDTAREHQRTLSSERTEILQQARDADSNTQLLNKLLDDPAAFNNSREDFLLTFPGGEAVQITGTGVERAQGVRDAVRLANESKTQIRENKSSLSQLVRELKAENKKAKDEDKKAVLQAGKAVLDSVETEHKKTADELKMERNSIQDGITKLKADIKTASKIDKNYIRDQKDSMKTTLTADKSLLKALKASVQDDEKQLNDNIKDLFGKLKVIDKDIAKYQGKLERELSNYARSSVQEGLERARDELETTTKLIDEKRRTFKDEHRAGQEQIDLLTKTVTGEKSELKGGGAVSDSEVEGLKKLLIDAEKQLKEKNNQIKGLKREHQTTKKEIKKLK